MSVYTECFQSEEPSLVSEVHIGVFDAAMTPEIHSSIPHLYAGVFPCENQLLAMDISCKVSTFYGVAQRNMPEFEALSRLW